MRRLFDLKQTRLQKSKVQQRSLDRLYGPTWKHLVKFLALKYGIHQQDACAIVNDVFQYVRSEVLCFGARFTIPHFGTFYRLFYDPSPGQPTHNLRGEYIGGLPHMRFTQRQTTEVPLRFDIEELVPPDEYEPQQFHFDKEGDFLDFPVIVHENKKERMGA